MNKDKVTEIEEPCTATPRNQSALIEPLGCSHEWERRDKQPWCLPFYICKKCEMELSVDQYNCVQQAFKAGADSVNALPHRVMFDEGFARGHEAAKQTALQIVEEYRCDACEDAFDNIITDISRMEP